MNRFADSVEISLLSAEGAKTQLTLFEAKGQVDVGGFLAANVEAINEALASCGGLVLRGFGAGAATSLEDYSSVLLREPMSYRDRASPRSHVAGAVFTSTDAPESLHIRMHCESSFTARWPSRIMFQCITPASGGGATPVCDVRRVYERVPARLRDRMEALGVSYVRHFGDGPGMGFREVFQVQDEEELRVYCRVAGITVSKTPDGQLRLWQTRPASARHPQTQERVWFNHACTLHVSLIEGGLRDTLRAQFGPGRLPHNTYFGDGSEISDADIAAIYAAYEAETLRFGWEAGDVLVLDNMLMAHGRDPYQGARRVVVSMGDALSWGDVEHSATAPFSPEHLDSMATSGAARVASSRGVADPELLLEKLLVITRRAIEVDDLSLDDSFFESGGDSVSAAIIVQELEEEVGAVMPLELIFSVDTVREWATELAKSAP